MPILNSEIQYRLSGGASNNNPNASLGGEKSSTLVGDTLFDNVPSSEAAVGSVEYRCIYVHNANSTLTLIDPKVWLVANTPSPTTSVSIGIGTSVQGGVEQSVADETTAPVGVTFSEPSSFATGISLGDIPAGGHRAVWERRTVNAGTVAIVDEYTLGVQGDSNP